MPSGRSLSSPGTRGCKTSCLVGFCFTQNHNLGEVTPSPNVNPFEISQWLTLNPAVSPFESEARAQRSSAAHLMGVITQM